MVDSGQRLVALPSDGLAGGGHANPVIFNGEQFDQETLRVLGVSFEQVCIALRTGDCDDDVKQAIANKVIELAKTGERNPDVLCEGALKDIRQSQVWMVDAASKKAPASLSGASSGAHLKVTV